MKVQLGLMTLLLLFVCWIFIDGVTDIAVEHISKVRKERNIELIKEYVDKKCLIK